MVTKVGRKIKLTIAFLLVVVGDKSCSLTDTIRVCSDAASVERVASTGTNNTVVGSCSITGLTTWRACRASCTRAKTAIWTNSPRTGSSRFGVTFGLVIGVLCETTLTRLTVSCNIRTCRTSNLADFTVAGGGQEESGSTFSASCTVVGSDPHSPLRQLQEEGALVMLKARHFPVPDMPSSQSRQPEGQAWQDKPKKPDSQDSQEAPVKPAAHEQVPDDVQIPLLEQAGSQAEDCMSTRDSEPDTASWEKSGTESQKTTRFVEPTLMAAQILDERASDCALREVEELPTGEVGRDENPAEPPYKELE
ncbi:hypothetical protein HHX47_DHR9000290 [Lentinula edodes]|nr:hypothetical protein HHX47_DHR9000290 [Lentinula edodes]